MGREPNQRLNRNLRVKSWTLQPNRVNWRTLGSLILIDQNIIHLLLRDRRLSTVRQLKCSVILIRSAGEDSAFVRKEGPIAEDQAAVDWISPGSLPRGRAEHPILLWKGGSGILDRLVHNAHRIEMRGDSMRKNRGKPNT